MNAAARATDRVPSGENAPHRRIVREIAEAPRCKNRFESLLRTLTFHSPEFYCEVLAMHVVRIEIWETEYFHAMENVEAILDWHRGTGLRPSWKR